MISQIHNQIRLPSSVALQVVLRGIRIRLGRSLVTVSGVVLGIAFLMSNLTSQHIRSSVSAENTTRQTVKLMESLVRGEIGDPQDRVIAVAVAGQLSVPEKTLLDNLLKAGPKEMRSTAWVGAPAGVRACPAAEVGAGASILLVLGNAPQLSSSIAQLTAGMGEKVILDSVANREYAEGLGEGVRREVFFGKEAENQAEKQRTEAANARFRTIWITLISVLVTVIGIANALLMSVTERFKEIGTMKCLGALSGFIRRMFLIESAIIGLTGAVVGTAAGALLTIVAYGWTFSFGLVMTAMSYGVLAGAAAFCIVAGTVLSMLAAIYPANFAARMVPASALRSNI